ncbi:Uncharacterised protein [uncultured archaeon]|nr:Uncharacterised protein [uncultured archaeon]
MPEPIKSLEDIEVMPSLRDVLPEDIFLDMDKLLKTAVFSKSDAERYKAEVFLAQLSMETIRRVFFADHSLFVTFEYFDRFRKPHQRTLHYMDLGQFTGNLFQIEYKREKP